MTEPDWANWEQQLFGSEPAEEVGEHVLPAQVHDDFRPGLHDLAVVQDVLVEALKMARFVFGEGVSVGTALDVFDRIMAYRINRLAVNGQRGAGDDQPA